MKVGANGFLRGSRGQSLVEFALILPMMLVVMFMITEFGRALFQYNVLTTASREGVRQAVVSSSTTWQGVAQAAADSILTKSNIDPTTVTFTPLDFPNFGGTNVHVIGLQLQKPFNWAIKGPITMQGNATAGPASGAFTLHAVTYMKTENF